MVKNFLFFLFFLMILVVTVQAQETINEQIPSFQFNHNFDLKRACFDQGFFCSSSFNCNITLIYPNGQLLIDNQLMSDQGSYRNISITSTQNNQLGFIKAIQSCNNGTLAGPDTFLVAITGDGKPFQTFPQQFVIMIITLVLICIGMVNDRLKLFKTLGSMMAMVLGIITLYPGYSFINYSTLLGQSLGIILVGLGFYFFIEDSFSRNKQEDTFDQQPESLQMNHDN